MDRAITHQVVLAILMESAPRSTENEEEEEEEEEKVGNKPIRAVADVIVRQNGIDKSSFRNDVGAVLQLVTTSEQPDRYSPYLYEKPPMSGSGVRVHQMFQRMTAGQEKEVLETLGLLDWDSKVGELCALKYFCKMELAKWPKSHKVNLAISNALVLSGILDGAVQERGQPEYFRQLNDDYFLKLETETKEKILAMVKAVPPAKQKQTTKTILEQCSTQWQAWIIADFLADFLPESLPAPLNDELNDEQNDELNDESLPLPMHGGDGKRTVIVVGCVVAVLLGVACLLLSMGGSLPLPMHGGDGKGTVNVGYVVVAFLLGVACLLPMGGSLPLPMHGGDGKGTVNVVGGVVAAILLAHLMLFEGDAVNRPVTILVAFLAGAAFDRSMP